MIIIYSFFTEPESWDFGRRIS